MREWKALVAVDWDGTCVPHEWPRQPREWLPGAVEALHEMLESSDVTIFSCRCNPDSFWPRRIRPQSDEVAYVRSMLDEAGLREVTIYTGHGKPNALTFVDDRGLRFRNWEQASAEVAFILKARRVT